MCRVKMGSWRRQPTNQQGASSLLSDDAHALHQLIALCLPYKALDDFHTELDGTSWAQGCDYEAAEETKG